MKDLSCYFLLKNLKTCFDKIVFLAIIDNAGVEVGGYSSVVELQLPKLAMWVRFPLPAPFNFLLTLIVTDGIVFVVRGYLANLRL